MAAIDDLTAAVKAAEAKIDAAAALIPQLKATIANLPVADAAMQSLATELNAHVSGLESALNPPTPAPTPAPAA